MKEKKNNNKGDKPKKSPLWLMIRQITLPDLQQLIFEKVAKAYKIDWGKIEYRNLDLRADQIHAEILELQGDYSELNVRRTLRNSRMLSCDVSAGFDPNFAGVFEKKNSAFLGLGVCFNKYTGARGKSGSNDANAEYMAKLRRIMDENKICWQTAELPVSGKNS